MVVLWFKLKTGDRELVVLWLSNGLFLNLKTIFGLNTKKNLLLIFLPEIFILFFLCIKKDFLMHFYENNP